MAIPSLTKTPSALHESYLEVVLVDVGSHSTALVSEIFQYPTVGVRTPVLRPVPGATNHTG